MQTQSIRIQKDMALVPSDYKRMLTAAVPVEAITEIKQGLRIAAAHGDYFVYFETLNARVLGSLALQRCLVTYEFPNWSQDKVEEYLAWLDPYFQRGGG